MSPAHPLQAEEFEALQAIYGDANVTFREDYHTLLVAIPDTATFAFEISPAYPENLQCPIVSFPSIHDKHAWLTDSLQAKMETAASTSIQYGQVCLFDMIEAAMTYLQEQKDTFNDEYDSPPPSFASSKSKKAKAPPPPPPSKSKAATKKPNSPPAAKSSMRTATDVIHRMLWDDQINQHEVVVGYLDRFLGIMERPITSFNWGDISTISHMETAIPKHRIQYFKWKGDIVWDKRCRMDRVFGSSGHDVVDFSVADASDVSNAAAVASPQISAADIPYFPPFYTNHDRPNAFLCIRITSPEVVAACVAVQESIVARDPRLRAALLPSQKLHCTLRMLRLASVQDLTVARRVLQESQGLLHRCLSSVQLHLSGVSNFGNRVIHAEVNCPALSEIVALLHRRLAAVGVGLIGNHDPFQAHVTLCKLSRDLSKRIQTIDRASYADVATQSLGVQRIEAIEFCAVGPQLDSDRFYSRLAPSLPISVPPPTLPIEFPAVAPPCAIILRGVPGSGKSTLARAITEHCKTKQWSFSVCSADTFFDTIQFDKSRLSEAHDDCRERFVQALSANVDVVVVDNTNLQAENVQSYLDLVAATVPNLYKTYVWPLEAPDAAACVRRSVHEIPPETMARYVTGGIAPLSPTTLAAVTHMESLRSPMTPKPAKALSLPSSIVYAAVFLDDASKARLRGHCQPIHDQVVIDHVTIAFQPSAELIMNLHLGSTVKFEATAMAANATVQAVVVSQPHVGGWENPGKPHVTISVTKGTPPKASHELLATTHAVPLPFSIPLSGVVGVCLSGQRRLTTFSDFLGASDASSGDHPVSLSSASSVSVPPTVKSLHVFDFDLTLVRAPPRHHGIQVLSPEQQAQIGNDWYRSPLSLHPKQKLVPLPALAELKAIDGATETMGVVLTARSVKLTSAVSAVLATFGAADVPVIGKPEHLIADLHGQTQEAQTAARAEENIAFKLSALATWVQANPQLDRLVVYEDDDAILEALYSWSGRQTSSLSIEIIDSKRMYMGKPFSVVQWLKNLGGATSSAYWARAEAVLKQLQEYCGTSAVVRPFGSFALHRSSDLDVLVSIPNHETARQAVERVAATLRRHGFVDIYESGSSRCPLLKIRWPDATAAPIDLDIVFAHEAALAAFDATATTEINFDRYFSSNDPDDRAILGLATLCHVQSTIQSSGSVSFDVFARCVDVVVHQFKAQCLHGTAYNPVPTFKITEAVAAYCSTLQGAQLPLKDVVQGFYASSPRLNYDNVFVSPHLQACVAQAFAEGHAICTDESFPSSGTLARLVQRREACVDPSEIISLRVSYAPLSRLSTTVWTLTQWFNWAMGKALRELYRDHNVQVDPMFPTQGMARTFGVLGNLDQTVAFLKAFASRLATDSEQQIQVDVVVAAAPPLSPSPPQTPKEKADEGKTSEGPSVLMKFPRTKHLLANNAISRDDLVLDPHDAAAFLKTRVTCQEKVDGANLGFFLTDDFQVVAQNRSHFTTAETAPQFKGLDMWIQVHQFELCELLSPPGRYVLYGEWLYAQHSIAYSKLPSYFLAFDIYDRETQTFWSVAKVQAALEETSIHMVPTVFSGVCSSMDDFKAMLETKSEFYDGPVEGVVIRKETPDELIARAKLVRDDFIQHIDEHWTKKGVVKNQLHF
ncbi:unnamed protein product [Aphanomyces euteiches]